MTELEFRSTDKRFGFKVHGMVLREVLRLCERSAPNETGGILLGHYSTAHDFAVVTAITAAPTDSRSGRTWFIRGVRGLQRTVDRLWSRQRDYYLGEWHFHPGGAPISSSTDIQQMREIAESEQYHCPEPVLLIIGGDPKGSWQSRAYVFPRNRSHLELHAESLIAKKGELVK